MLIYLFFGYLAFSVAIADLGYPGRNKKKLAAIKSEWDDYYHCLQNDYAQRGNTKQRKIEVVYVFPGQWADLSCVECHRPFTTLDDIIWKQQKLQNITNTTPTLLDLSAELSITHNKVLQLRNARTEFSGLYQCFRGNNSLNAYLVEIPENVTMTQLATSNVDTAINATTSIMWGNWTNCSACGGQIGKQFQFGICTINYSDTNLNEKILPLQDFFDKFINGLSCSSQFLPKELLINLSNETHYVAVKYCKEDCQTNEEKLTIDPKQINIEELADTLDNLNSRMPTEESQILDADIGSRLVLQCPGALIKNIPVTWTMDNKTILPEVIQNETSGRVTIDFFQRLVIEKALLMDTAKYSCWQQQTHVGNIHIYVNEADVQLDNSSMIVLSTLITITVMIVALRALRRCKRRARRKASIKDRVTSEEKVTLTEDMEEETSSDDKEEEEIVEEGGERTEQYDEREGEYQEYDEGSEYQEYRQY